MKIHLLSDLHLEVSNYLPHPQANAADVIVLAGDIWSKDYAIPWARTTWPDHRIVYVAGNHEFYHEDRAEVISSLRDSAKTHVVDFLDNDEVLIEGVRFLGCTLWTDFRLYGDKLRDDCMMLGERYLKDFSVIQEGESTFTARSSVNLHKASVEWLHMKLRRASFEGKTVVVTHHAPSWRSVVHRYQKDLLSACFASKLDDLMGFSALWLHGHMHDSIDYIESGTRVICNPRGYTRYVGGEENELFNPQLLIEI